MRTEAFIVVAAFGLVIAMGLAGRRGRADMGERFAARRELSWLVLGVSMAATATSADTALLVSGAVYKDGLAGNWFWWAGAPGVIVTLAFFARLWRRSGVLTELEIIRLRYGDDRATRHYRRCRALADGVLINTLVMASSMMALRIVLAPMIASSQSFGAIPADVVVIALFVAAAGYAIAVGFRGLVRSNSLEYLLVVFTSLVIGLFAYFRMPEGFATLAKTTALSGASALSLRPSEGWLPVVALLAIGWWHTAPGNGMLVQRIAAARDERVAVLTVLVFLILHYLVRPWGWYLGAFGALQAAPRLLPSEQALPWFIITIAPPTLAALFISTILLSFFSAVNSRLNLGASYILNDVLFAKGARKEMKYTGYHEVSSIIILTILTIQIFAIVELSSIRWLYQSLLTFMAGTGFVAIARWYWWKTTIVSEICSLCSAAVLAILASICIEMEQTDHFVLAMALNFLVGAAVTIAASHYGPQTSSEIVHAFYRRVRPGGAGWRHVLSTASTES